MKSFVRLVESPWDGIIAWQHRRLGNGLLEGTNSLIQAAKRRARGYRSETKMITVIYLIAGKLPLPQIHTILRGALVYHRRPRGGWTTSGFRPLPTGGRFAG